MITHRCPLPTNLSITCLLTLFLLTLTPLSSAQQLTGADVPAAIKDLKDGDARVRADAARRLVILSVNAKTATPAMAESAGPALVEALKDPDSKVRYRSVMALNSLWFWAESGPEVEAAVPALAALLSDDNEDTQVRAAYVLARLGPNAKAAVPRLTTQKDKAPRVQEAFRYAVETIGKATVADIPALIIELSDNNVQVRTRAAQRLLSLGTTAKPAGRALLAALKDRDDRVRFFSAMALGHLLNNLIETESDAGDVTTSFIEMLKDPYGLNRGQAAEGLGKIGPRARAAVPALTAALGDNAERVREHAASALQSIGWDSETTTTALIKLLKDPKYRVRHAAAGALSRVEAGASIAIPVLIGDLKNSTARWSAMWALDDYGAQAKDAVPVLAEMLTDPFFRTRLEVARLIGKIGPGAKAAVPFLVKSLKDREEFVREAVAVALLKVDPGSESKIEPALLKIAKAKIEQERAPASTGVGGWGYGTAPPYRWDEAGDYKLRADSLYRNGNHSEAIATYTKAIEFDPQFKDAYHNRGLTHRAQSDYDAAIADFTKAIQSDSEYSQVEYLERGVTQVLKRNYDAGIADFTKAIELDNYYAEAYYRRGLAYYEKKDYNAAMADFDRALEIVPPPMDVFHIRAQLKLEQGNVAGALADYDEAIRVNPKSSNNYDTRNEALRSQGKVEAAENLYRSALRESPDDPDLLNRVGYFLVEQNKSLPEALKLIQRAVAARPANAIFLHSLGWAYFKLDRLDEAQRYLEESVRQDSDSALSLEHLGDLYARRGKKEKANPAWNRALSLSADADTKTKTRLKVKLNLAINIHPENQ